MAKKTTTPAPTDSPTVASYGSMDAAYDHFNIHLFGGQLPRCLITVARHSGAYGYFAPDRFTNAANPDVNACIHEIALNPQHFAKVDRGIKKTLSTLVHEMVHLKQAHEGTAAARGYHNKLWAALMLEVGLAPFELRKDGQPTGRAYGQRCSHEIIPGGAFDVACDRFMATSPPLLFHDRWEDENTVKVAKKKRASKTKYTCPTCQDNVWGKPGLSLRCNDCVEDYVAEPTEDEEPAEPEEN